MTEKKILMSSDWRALIHYVDEGGVIPHMEQNTKMGSKQTPNGTFKLGVGVWILMVLGCTGWGAAAAPRID